MATPVLNQKDFNWIELLNVRLQNLASDPTGGAGRVYYNTTNGKFMYHNGTAFIDPVARANHTGSQLASTISDFDTQVRTSRLSQMTGPAADVAWGGFKITGLGTPTASGDAATKGYVDTSINGLDWKPSAKVAATTNITIASPGAAIDGITMAANDIVLLTGQTTTSQNGPWIWNGAAVPMTRPTWWAAASVQAPGATIVIEQGTNADKMAIMTTDTNVTVDTTANAWSIIGTGNAYTAGNGLSLTTNTFAVVAAAAVASGGPGGGLVVGAGGVSIDTAVVVRKYTTVLATSATSYTVNHALGNQWVQVKVVENSGSFREVEVEVQLTDANNCTVLFTTAPTSSAYRVIVQG